MPICDLGELSCIRIPYRIAHFGRNRILFYSVIEHTEAVMEKAAIHAFMARFRYGVLSSISSDGTPQSALVGIATTPDLEIIFDTVKSSRKYPNLIRNSCCSFVVGWDGEQTVQFEGVAIEPQGEELRRYQEAYFAAWPDGPARMSWPGIAYFVVRPTWIRYSDFDQKPPLVEEIAFPGSR
jgi:pyridoxine/pyridoxamine 5'-phosphate oxidase